MALPCTQYRTRIDSDLHMQEVQVSKTRKQKGAASVQPIQKHFQTAAALLSQHTHTPPVRQEQHPQLALVALKNTAAGSTEASVSSMTSLISAHRSASRLQPAQSNANAGAVSEMLANFVERTQTNAC